jgi:hypothetical protein|tara:strand:+ start:308 stop:439 length:132 start_codon:yes stop_codon:yes gene_type:complete
MPFRTRKKRGKLKKRIGKKLNGAWEKTEIDPANKQIKLNKKKL